MLLAGDDSMRDCVVPSREKRAKDTIRSCLKALTDMTNFIQTFSIFSHTASLGSFILSHRAADGGVVHFTPPTGSNHDASRRHPPVPALLFLSLTRNIRPRHLRKLVWPLTSCQNPRCGRHSDPPLIHPRRHLPQRLRPEVGD